MEKRINSKGQVAGMDAAMSGLIGLIFVALLLVALWPVADNLIQLTNAVPNFSLYQPITDFVPLLLVFGVVAGIIVAIRKQSEPRQF